MASEASTNQGARNLDEELQGGTQSVEPSRHVSKDSMKGGTPDTTARSGSAHTEPPSETQPRTPIGHDEPGHAPKEHTPNEEGPGAKKV